MADDQLEDEESKTEEPTHKRLEDALEKGQIINSKEVTNFFVLITFAGMLIWILPFAAKEYLQKLAGIIEHSGEVSFNKAMVGQVIVPYFNKTLLLLLPAFLLAIIAAIFSTFIQNAQFVFSTEKLAFDLSNISIFKGIDRLFSARSFVEFLKGLVKIVVIGIILYLIIRSDISQMLFYQDMPIQSILLELTNIIKHLLIAAVVVVAAIAALDYSYQRYEYYKSMRMSRYEVKQEFKQTQGNPEIKQKQRSLARERIKNQIKVVVPKADVIITNPEHYAVALQYDANKMAAPIVIAKGVDMVAQVIKELAKEADVPIVRDPPLARSLYKAIAINQAISVEHYQAVARVISYVYSLKRRKNG